MSFSITNKLLQTALENPNKQKRADAANNLALISNSNVDMIAWATMAANLGHEIAQVSLGIMHEANNPLFAEQMYQKALSVSGEAQYRYGNMLLNKKQFLKGIWLLQKSYVNGYIEPLDVLKGVPQHIFPSFELKEKAIACTHGSCCESSVIIKKKDTYIVETIDTKRQVEVKYYLLQKKMTWL